MKPSLFVGLYYKMRRLLSYFCLRPIVYFYKGEIIVHDIVMTLITALIPVVMAVVGYYLAKYVKTPTQLQTITDLVDAAVVFAEKSGAVQQLTGSQQFKLAYNFVQDRAKQLGITELDEELIKTLIEQSWANQREHLDVIYESGKKQADEEAAVDEKTKLIELKEQLANEKQEIEKERKALKSTVNALQGALNQNQPDTEPDTKADTQDSKSTNGAKPVSE